MNDQTVIIGGGVIGMMTARMLHQQGKDVVLLEKGQLGKESSWAGGGIVSPLYPWRYADEISRLSQYGQQHYATVCNELHNETGIDPEWIQSGLIMLSHDELSNAQQWSTRFSANLDVLDNAAALQAVETELNPQFQQAMWMPDIGQIRNPRLLKSLKASLLKRNIPVKENTKAIGFEQDKQGAVTGVITNHGTVECGQVIVATGAWSGQFSALRKVAINVKPVLGEMILFKCKPNQLKRIVLHKGRYLIPRKDGRILCGSTLQFTDFEKQTTDTAREQLRLAACEMAPFLHDVEIEHHWCGLRPGSPNGIPYIGEHPEIKNLYVNTGHYRYGVVIGLGSIKLLLDHLNNKKSFMDIASFNLQRERPPSSEFVSL